MSDKMPFMFSRLKDPMKCDVDKFIVIIANPFDWTHANVAWMDDPDMPDGLILQPSVDMSESYHEFNTEKDMLTFVAKWWNKNCPTPIYEVSIPVTNYDKTDVFFQTLHFRSHRGPSKEDVVALLKSYLSSTTESIDIDSVWVEALKIVEDAEEFPSLGCNVCMSNTHVNHPVYGQQPLTITRLDIHTM